MIPKFDFTPKPIALKALLALLLAVVALLLFFTNRDTVKENQKMLKYIKNEEKLRGNLQLLRQSETTFHQHVIPLETSSDTEKIKGDTIALILKIINKNNLKVDSYRSEIEETDGFVVFKYNITIVGTFLDVVQFFSRLPKEAKNIYIKSYSAKLHQETMVRAGLQVEALGVR